MKSAKYNFGHFLKKRDRIRQLIIEYYQGNPNPTTAELVGHVSQFVEFGKSNPESQQRIIRRHRSDLEKEGRIRQRRLAGRTREQYDRAIGEIVALAGLAYWKNPGNAQDCYERVLNFYGLTQKAVDEAIEANERTFEKTHPELAQAVKNFNLNKIK